MSEWKKVKLGDCCEITSSKRIFLSEYVDKGIPFYRSKEIAEKAKHEEVSDPLYISEERYEEIKSKYGIPVYGDILLTAIGATLGIPYVVGNEPPFYFKDGNLIWLRNFNKELHSGYLHSWMASNFGYQSLQNVAIGSAQKALTIAAIKSLEIALPPIETQHRIATILSRYDSLIENYQKQIKLLEEAALRLYKEWFIDLRFPGYENANIVDGVPEGWEKKKLEDFCNVFTGKKNANAAEQNGKYKFFTCSDTPLKINSFIYDGAAILISGNGSYTGRTTFYEGKFDLYQRTYACTIKENVNPILIYGLYEAVKCELTTQISGGTHGAAIPYIVMADVTQFNFLYNEYVMLKFSEIMNCNLSQNLSLQSQLRLLTEARDRLLPKLMSGEIEV